MHSGNFVMATNTLRLLLATVFATVLWVSDLQAQRLAVLDDFSGRLINPNMWSADLSPRTKVDNQFLDAERGQENGSLFLRGRQYGTAGDDVENMTGGYYGIRLNDRIGRRIDTISVRIKIDRADSRYCENGEISFAGTLSQIDGMFVKDRNAVGMQGAFRSFLVMLTLNPTPDGLGENQYRVGYETVMCLNPACSKSRIVNGKVLGDAQYGQWIDVEINHDRNRRLMRYAMRSNTVGAAALIPYPDSIVNPVSVDNPNIAIATRTRVPQCPADILPRPYAAYEISIGRVSVNPSALRVN